MRNASADTRRDVCPNQPNIGSLPTAIVDHETIGSEDWDELILNLEATIPVYDRINRFATIGQVDKWRRMVRERLPSEDAKILEVGCGPGSFAEDVSGVDLVCLDPSVLMLEAAKPRVNSQ